MDECIEWTGPKNKGGYGYLWDGARRRILLAHRDAWAKQNGPIPDGGMICHKCGNRACVNPDHLYLGDNSSNMKDAVAHGTHWSPRGNRHHKAKLDFGKAQEIRRRRKMGHKVADICRDYDIAAGTYSQVISGATWKAPEGAV